MRGKVVNLFSDESHLLDDRALAFLVSQEDPMEVSRRVLERMSCLETVPLVLGLSDVKAALEGSSTSVVMVPSSKDENPRVQKLPDDLGGGHKISTQAALSGDRPVPPSKQVRRTPPPPAPRTHVTSSVKRLDAECSIDILQDITGDSTCSGCISDFTKYFQDRFARLKRLIVNRREMLGAVPVAAIRNRGGDVKVIGMVVEKQTTSKGGVIFTIEDGSGRIKVLSTGTKGTPTDIVNDEVVGVVGTTNPKRDLVYAEQIVRPEIPVRRIPHHTDRDLHVAFAADIHVGSNTFLDTQWNRFMDFLNGRLDNGNGTNGILDSLEVIIVPGDVVDGIGVFPGQQEELLIDDIYRQYEALAELLKDVPDHIEVIMSPGNHDAVRLAEPQPALPNDVQRMFAGKVTFVGNPALIDIEGVNILAYHGKSIDDFVTHVQACTYEDPVTVMKEMLKRRHLAPMYGGRTNIAPEANDHLVVETIPDIFVTGHVHGTGVERYRGTTLINASAWQDQTRYQKSMNFVPDPAKVPIVNLKDMSIKLMDFAT
ncbi:MAG: DNA-directed DNA polymerase II small subunit [Thermoplasmata archaeon]|nr:MAG: DNA-directed DNA polymerase II small subunit [Thermoplasmata archaeon]